MEWIEVTGRTLEEAIERALDSLGVHETELDYEVLTEPKTSLLGLRRTDARIRARVKPRSREKPNDKRRRQRDESRARRRGGRDRGGDGDAKREPKKAAVAAGEGRSGDGRSRERAAAAGSAAAAEANGGAAASPGTGNGSRSRRRRRGSGNGAPNGAPDGSPNAAAATTEPNGSGNASGRVTNTAPKVTDRPASKANHEEHEVMERSGSIEEQVQAGREFATGLLDAFETTGTVTVAPEDHEIEVSIEGDNLGLLVGPKGATLAALEELLRGAVGHRGPGRLHLDVAGYRAKRRAALSDFARKVADDVRASGTAKALEPMSAPDRKVVHDTVAELDGVGTISDGEDPRRRVIIQPA
jgi:spoIIIJ-associated protein